MKTLEKRVMERNYKKRFIAIIITAAIMAVLTAGTAAILCSTQISEAVEYVKEHRWYDDLEDEIEGTRNETAGTVNNSADNSETDNNHRGIWYSGRNSRNWNGYSHRYNAFKMMKEITPLPVSSIVIFGIIGLLWAALSIFYWITLIEWLYKTAAEKGLNKALWPILGVFFHLLAVLAILIVINSPKRMQVKQCSGN